MSETVFMSNSEGVVVNAKQPSIKLSLIEKLLEAFHNSEINYCHCGSHETLDASLMGNTDIDILFDPTQKKQLDSLFNQLGLKKFEVVNERKIEDIEDYIGLDLPSGKIVHIHTHFKLPLGESNFKNYQLNLEDRVLNTRVWDEEFRMYRMSPALDLVFLFFKQAFKIRKGDNILINKTGKGSHLTDEYNWLRLQCSNEEIASVLSGITSNHQSIYTLITTGFNRDVLLKLSPLLKKECRSNRTYSSMQAFLINRYRDIYIRISKMLSGMTSSPMTLLRANPRGGLAIAIIGADGSGKSTVIKNLDNTFKKKLDVYKIYFGKGVGKMSWYRKLLVTLKGKAGSIKNRDKSKESNTYVQFPLDELIKKQVERSSTFYSCIEAWMVAREKYSNLKRMQKARQKGMLVICDRYPQNQFLIYNDGPVLQHLATSKNPFSRFVAKREAHIYKLFDHYAPDIVFKLIADAEIVEARKPGKTQMEILKAKINWIKELNFPAPCKVITVNAAAPLEDVLASVKGTIWEAYK